MKTALDKVRAFHKKYGFRQNDYDFKLDPKGTIAFADATRNFCTDEGSEIAESYEEAKKMQEGGDARMYRFLLMLEELMETGVALKTMDRQELGDALGDLVYVVLGTAVQFGIPLDKVFDAVHTSNMTKTGYENGRRSAKGKGHREPDFSHLNCEVCGKTMVDTVDSECPDCRH